VGKWTPDQKWEHFGNIPKTCYLFSAVFGHVQRGTTLLPSCASGGDKMVFDRQLTGVILAGCQMTGCRYSSTHGCCFGIYLISVTR
jgi:hypothetical protein